jgi:hypothetical protein
MSANSVAEECWLTGGKRNLLRVKYDSAGMLRGPRRARFHRETCVAL